MNVIGQIHSNRSTDYLLYFVVGYSKFTIKLHDIRHSCPYEEAAQAITTPLQPHDLSPCTFVTQCRNVQTVKQTAVEYFPDLTMVVVSLYQKDEIFV